MSHFEALAFTPVVKALQEKYGSRRQYARMEGDSSAPDRLGRGEIEFIQERDSFYIASLGSTGWPYVQHRGGPKGFLKVIDDQTLAFADFRGNKQFVTTGNLATNNRVALIMIDYPRQARFKLLGRAEVLEGEQAHPWIERLRDPDYKAVSERACVITVEAYSWNCPHHIIPRFTAEQIHEALGPLEARLQQLEHENQQLRETARKHSEGVHS